jgi:hypothetical protein
MSNLWTLHTEIWLRIPLLRGARVKGPATPYTNNYNPFNKPQNPIGLHGPPSSAHATVCPAPQVECTIQRTTLYLSNRLDCH